MMARVASRAEECDGEGGLWLIMPTVSGESSEHKSYTPSRTPQSSDHMGRMEAISWAGRVETKER